MFYDKSIDILVESEGYLNTDGIWVDGEETPVGYIPVDVQPYSRDRAYRDHGFNEEVSYRVFSDPDMLLKVGTKINYNSERYVINKIVDWDDYYEWMIKDD